MTDEIQRLKVARDAAIAAYNAALRDAAVAAWYAAAGVVWAQHTTPTPPPSQSKISSINSKIT
jgi:hypothetical protein